MRALKCAGAASQPRLALLGHQVCFLPHPPLQGKGGHCGGSLPSCPSDVQPQFNFQLLSLDFITWEEENGLWQIALNVFSLLFQLENSS